MPTISRRGGAQPPTQRISIGTPCTDTTHSTATHPLAFDMARRHGG
jgi:hypothetical protein